MSEERRQNRLANEPSPYLQQHAHNPVDWYPWGEEALEKARREDKPILLSIGYSACHWCHVMERESFANEEIARQMNESFVNIKVDREERPDLDQVHQLVVQMLGRSGGWPLTVFLTPSLRPYFGGTYFPPEDRFGMPGFPRVLSAVAEAYRERRAEVEAQADEIAEGLTRAMSLQKRAPKGLPEPAFMKRASERLLSRFDWQHGGFGSKPKFPNGPCLEALLRSAVVHGDEKAKAAVSHALTSMRKGGIFDHLGGGFHRYSTDEKWLVPHFEKMLYDNALLLRLYVDAYRAFGDPLFADTAKEIVGWLVSEMQSDEGGFFSALDADSEGEEGKFYVFTLPEVEDALADDALALEVAKLHFGLIAEGNFESTGACVLHEAKPVEAVAEAVGKSLAEVKVALDRAKEMLLARRSKRERPFRDEKVLASWNGLVIGALAEASMALEVPSWLAAAEKAFAHVERDLLRDGKVLRMTKDGVAKGTGFLDDYAFLAWAALDLYEATGKPHYLARAKELADALIDDFWDEESAVFFYTPHGGEELLVRPHDPYDQSIPSGASISALVLLRLGAIVDERYADYAQRQLERVAAMAVQNPFAFGQTISVLDRLMRGSWDVVVVGEAGDPRTSALVQATYRHYLPNRNLVRIDPSEPASRELPKLIAEGKAAMEKPVAYFCRDRTCSLPLEDPSALEAEIRSSSTTSFARG